jgi:hypothetical protein
MKTYNLTRAVAPSYASQSFATSPQVDGQTGVAVSSSGGLVIGGHEVPVHTYLGDMLDVARNTLSVTNLNINLGDDDGSNSREFDRLRLSGMPDDVYLFVNKHSGNVYMGLGDTIVSNMTNCESCGSGLENLVEVDDTTVKIDGVPYQGKRVKDEFCGAEYLRLPDGKFLSPLLALQKTNDGRPLRGDELKDAVYARTKEGYDVILFDFNGNEKNRVAQQMIILDRVFFRYYGNPTTEARPWDVSVDFYSGQSMDQQQVQINASPVQCLVGQIDVNSLPDYLKRDGVAVLDASQSMENRGKSKLLKKVISNLRQELAQKLKNITLIEFEDSSKASILYTGNIMSLTREKINELRCNGQATDILSGLEKALTYAKNAAIVLLTDGAANTGFDYKNPETYISLSKALINAGARIVNAAVIENGPPNDILAGIGGGNGIYRELKNPATINKRALAIGEDTLSQVIRKMVTLGKGEIEYCIKGNGRSYSGTISLNEVTDRGTFVIPLTDDKGKNLEIGEYTLTAKLKIPLEEQIETYTEITAIRLRSLRIMAQNAPIMIKEEEDIKLSNYLRGMASYGMRINQDETRKVMSKLIEAAKLPYAAALNITLLTSILGQKIVDNIWPIKDAEIDPKILEWEKEMFGQTRTMGVKSIGKQPNLPSVPSVEDFALSNSANSRLLDMASG